LEHFFEASSYHVSWFALPLVGIEAFNRLLGLRLFDASVARCLAEHCWR
jgi:hypothetical protein